MIDKYTQTKEKVITNRYNIVKRLTKAVDKQDNIDIVFHEFCIGISVDSSLARRIINNMMACSDTSKSIVMLYNILNYGHC